jgi:large subunit ribosomal protein L15
MQLNQLKRLHKNKSEKRVARGGKRGKTAGRGTKGQKARAGHRIRPEMRDIIKKYPKMRGRGKNTNKAFAVKATPVNLEAIELAFVAGDAVNPETLLAKKVIATIGGRTPKVKILATGKLTKNVTVSGCIFSATAKKAIEAAGGSIA